MNISYNEIFEYGVLKYNLIGVVVFIYIFIYPLLFLNSVILEIQQMQVIIFLIVLIMKWADGINMMIAM